MKNKVLFDRINRKTQKKTTNLSQVIDNFILILLLNFFKKNINYPERCKQYDSFVFNK